MPSPRTVERFAPAKVNLTLHVTGRRADGYHLLDSLVVFAGIGDHVRVSAAPRLSLDVDGPGAAGVPTDGRNLMLRAARLYDPPVAARLHLEKHLPAASGIGGGSADAAATLHALAMLAGRPLPGREEVLSLGADVPVCLAGRPVRMRGIGEDLAPAPPLPSCWLVLVNPGQSVATGQVFGGLSRAANAPMAELPSAGWPDVAALAGWLSAQRNDLQAPALAVVPVIAAAIERLAERPGCHLARMSGSGATCFGLFATEDAARASAGAIRDRQPGWWVAAAPVLRATDAFS